MILKQATDVTPTSGDVEIESTVRCIRVGVTGDIKVLLSKDNSAVTLKNVGPTDPVLPFLRIKKIFLVGTTAQNIVAFT